MKTQTITLKIRVEDDYSLPEDWDWQGLLDLAPSVGESVEIMEIENENL